MDRRAFLKGASAMAGALLVPTRLLAKVTAPPFDITAFCDDEWFRRYDLKLPFEQGGTTYATDSRVCVRTKLIHAPAGSSEARLPDASGLPYWTESDRWHPWPKQQLVPDRGFLNCPVCYGRGRVGDDVRVCERCGGENECCPVCDGCDWIGGVLCDYCGSRTGILGLVPSGTPTLQLVGDLLVAPKYDAKIRKLDCVEYQELRCVPPARGMPDRCVRFRFNGGDGVLTPVG